MELLKVFVGDGTTSIKTIAGLTQGDMLLVKASDNSVLTQTTGAALSNSEQVRVVSKNSKGLVFSTPFSRNEVVKVNYVAGSAVTPKVMSATLTDIGNTSTTSFSTTFSLGVQIKEDLRMGTYNKNTEVIVSATTPSTAYSSVVEGMKDITSTMAKGFAANPLTSAGSPSQLITVERSVGGTVTALASTGATLAVTQGAREVTLTHATLTTTPAVGNIISISGKVYLIEKYTTVSSTVKIITLDTAYQGVTAGSLSANTSGVVGIITTANVTASSWKFTFTGVSQTRTNKFDQYRVVDFVLVYPKGYDASTNITVATDTALVYGKGTWAQVRDMEERSFTNINPLVNYREFPFSDYNLNADTIATNTLFDLFTIVHTASDGYGYNFMQSSTKSFPQVTVCALPDGSADATPDNDDNFSSVLVGWWVADAASAAADFGGNENFDLS